MTGVFGAFVFAALAQAPPGNPLASALAAGRFEEALRLSDGILKTAPKDPRLWTARGLAQRGLGRTGEALASFDRALDFDKQFVPALRAAAETAFQGRAPGVPRYLERLLALAPADETANAMAGTLAYEANDCGRAVLHFEAARRAVGEDDLAVTQFSHCLIERGRPADAVPLLTAALERKPNAPGMRYNLAVALLAAGRAAESLTALEGARQDSGTLNLLGRARYQAGDVTGALDALRRAIDQAPDDERNYMDLAIIGLERGAFEPVLAVLDAGLKRRADSARLLLLRGIAQAQSGGFDKAAADFERAERLAPEQAYGPVGLSVLLSESQQLREAAALLRKRLAGAPSDYMLNYLLADSLMRDGVQPGQPEFEEARKALEQSIAARPTFAKAHAALGRLLMKTGGAEWEAAVAALRTAIEYDPSNRVALNQLLLAMRAAGRTAEAAELAERLRRLVAR
jgi:tetratricopeptide (TPR) repeat protein